MVDLIVVIEVPTVMVEDLTVLVSGDQETKH